MANLLNKFSLAGKTALVICPENPYGKEIVQGLLDAGASVWVAGSQECWGELPVTGRFLYTHGDAISAKELEKDVRTRLGCVDIIIENGLHTKISGWSQSYEQIYEQLEKTHLGMMLTVQSLGHILAEQGHGSVILIADYGALVGYDVHNYGDSQIQKGQDFSLVKGFIGGGVVNYARQASNYLAEHGCRCNAIAFGPIEDTCEAGFKKSYVRHSQLKRFLTPQDIAAAITFLGSDASAYITGITLPVDGGYTAK